MRRNGGDAAASSVRERCGAVDDDFGNVTDTTPAVSTSLVFEEGPVWLAFGYETIEKRSDALAADATQNPQLFRAAAMYQQGSVVLAGLFQRGIDQQGIDDQNRNVLGGGGSYWFTASLRLGGQIYHARDMDTLDESGATMYAGEIEYRLYPRARFYVSVGHTRNDANARFQSARGVIDDGPLGANSTSGAVAVRYDF